MPLHKTASATTQLPVQRPIENILIPVDLYQKLSAAKADQKLTVVTRKSPLGVDEKLVQMTRKEFQTLTLAATRPAPTPAPPAPKETWGTTATKVAVLAGALAAAVACVYYAFEYGKNAGINEVFYSGYAKAMNTAAKSCATATKIDACVNHAFKSTSLVEFSILPDWVHTAYQYASMRNLVIADHIGRYVIPYIVPIACGAVATTAAAAYAIRKPILGGARAVKNTLWPEGEWTAKKMGKLVLAWSFFMAVTGYGMYRYGKSVGITFGLKEWTEHAAQGMKTKLLNKFSGLLSAHQARVEHQALIGSGLTNLTPSGSGLVDVSHIGSALVDSSASQVGSAVANPMGSAVLDPTMASEVAELQNTALACVREETAALAQRSPTIFQAVAQTAEETKETASWAWTVLEWAPYVNTAQNFFFSYVAAPVITVGLTALFGRR